MLTWICPSCKKVFSLFEKPIGREVCGECQRGLNRLEALRTAPSPDTSCFVVSAANRQGPYLLEQLRNMWKNGAITADSVVEWEGQDRPLPIADVVRNTWEPRPADGYVEQPKLSSRPVGGVLLVIGGIMAIYGIVQLNSASYMIASAFGHGNNGSLETILFLGVGCAIAGVLLLVLPGTKSD